jgi:hypothetical protein
MHDRVQQNQADTHEASATQRPDQVAGPGLLGRLQQVAGNRAVTQFVQREPFGKPKESPYQLHLDPEIEAQIRAINAMNTMIAPDQVRAGLLNLNLPQTLPPPPPQTPPIPAPAPPAPATPGGPAPGTGLMGPREGTVGDMWKAVLAEPALGPAITALGDEATAKAKSEFGHLSTGGTVAVVSGAVTVGGGALTALLSNSDVRSWITATLNDKIIPVPKVPGLGVQLNLSGENIIVGLHLDVGQLLPAALGFGPASYTAPLGAPPSAFEPVQRQLMVHREPLTGGAGGQVSDATGGAITLQSVEGSFVLAGGKILSSTASRVLKTVGPVTVTVKISSDKVDVHIQGGVFIDAQWPVQNMRVYSVTHQFATNETTADVTLVSDEFGDGFIDMTDTAKKSIAETIGQIIARTPIDRSRLRPPAPSTDTQQPPGPQGPPVPAGSAFGDKLPSYDPLKDTDPQATLQALIANLQAMPADGESDVSAQDISKISVGATVAVNRQFEQIEGGTGVRITAGTPISVHVDSGATVAQLKDRGQGAAGIAAAARIQAIHATCTGGITVLKDNTPVAAIHEVTISRGGAVKIDKFSLLGDAAGAGALESLFWVGLGGLGGVAETGVPLGGVLGAEKTIEEGNARPVLVGGLVKDKLEAKLQAAFTDLLAQYGRALIPGVDLGSVLGVPGAPVAPK